MTSNRVKWKLCYLMEDIERDVSRALNSFPSPERSFDERFKKLFLRSISNRLNEAFDRFELDLLLNKNLSNKSKGLRNEKNDDVSSHSAAFRREQQPSNGHRSRSSTKKTKNKHKKRRTRSRRSSLSLTDKSSYELEKQKRFSNNICIMNATSFNPELDDPYALFGKICREIAVNIEADDIVTAYRTNTNGHIIVQLSSATIKRHILQSSSRITICTNQLFDVSPPIVPLKVRIINFATPYFISMMHLAKQFQNRGIIRSYHMESNGLLIKKHTASKGKIFISKIVLTKYLEKRERKKAAKRNIV